MDGKDSKPEDRVIAAVEKVAGAVDRYGVPAVTFAVGAVALYYPAKDEAAKILPWLGTGLIIASLLTYIWQTWRSTTRVLPIPPSIPTEYLQLMDRLFQKVDENDKWQKDLINNFASKVAISEKVIYELPSRARQLSPATPLVLRARLRGRVRRRRI